MTKTSKPNLAQDLLRIHMIITRGLDVSIEKADQFAQEGFPDQELRDEYTSMWRRCYPSSRPII